MPILMRQVRNHLTHIKIMFLYLVKDSSGWMSAFVFKSIDQAIVSQSWRVEESRLVVCEDFPLTILQIDTEFGITREVKQVSKAEMIARFQKKDSEKKGGSK